MRNIQKVIAFIFVFLMYGCTSDDLFETPNDADKTSIAPKSGGGGSMTIFPTYSNTSIIVQYKSGTSASEKNTIRGMNGVTNYEECHCINQDIELWYFGGVIDVEPKKRAIKDQIDPESTTGVLEVDYEFVFGMDVAADDYGTAADVSYEPYIKSINSGVTIAIVDTGVAPGLTVFNDGDDPAIPIKFMYESGETAVTDEKSGWDFVDEDPNTYDDDLGKHGSIIADMITSTLSTNSIPHQILPVKVSNNLGETSYFNFLCGTQYAVERADVINMSLGWYDNGEDTEVHTIFENIMIANDSVIVVTSAGNIENNNDTMKHYPSSYDYSNIIAVASATDVHDKISEFSNFGELDVDYFAQGEGINFYDVNVEGTSFAAPQVVIEIVNIFDEAGFILAPDVLIDTLNTRGTTVSEFFKTRGGEVRNTKYNKLIIPFDD